MKHMKRIMITGCAGYGKTFLINRMLKDPILPSKSGYVPDGNVTKYPITITHDENDFSLEKYINDDLIIGWNGKIKVKKILESLERDKNDKTNTHFLLKCPFKNKYKNVTITDTFCAKKNELMTRYICRYKNNKESIFGIDEMVFLLSHHSISKNSHDEISPIESLSLISKENEIDFHVLHSMFTYEELIPLTDDKDDIDDAFKNIKKIVNDRINHHIKMNVNIKILGYDKSFVDFEYDPKKKRKIDNSRVFNSSYAIKKQKVDDSDEYINRIMSMKPPIINKSKRNDKSNKNPSLRDLRREGKIGPMCVKKSILINSQ